MPVSTPSLSFPLDEKTKNVYSRHCRMFPGVGTKIFKNAHIKRLSNKGAPYRTTIFGLKQFLKTLRSPK
jgi:uncharacterized protein YjhX (UPF0386 family)